MAVISRYENGIILLELEKNLKKNDTLNQISLRILSNRKPIHKLDFIIVRETNFFVIESPMFVIEQRCLACPNNLELEIKEIVSGISEFEKLRFEASFFLPHLDLSKSEMFPPFNYTAYDRPEKLAVFTHACNEELFLGTFINYYKKLTDPTHIYILDHGSDYRSQWLEGETGCQVIKIPRGQLDHLNIKRYVEYFQRFLLTQYEWVLHVDADELLIHEQGPAHLCNNVLKSYRGRTLQPKYGLNLIHNPLTERELQEDMLITLQRSHYQIAKFFNKPVLSSIPTTWGLGFHYNIPDHQNIVLDDLYLVHLSFVSIKERLRRNQSWSNYSMTSADAEALSEFHRTVSFEMIKAEFLEMLSNGTVRPPASFMGQF